MKNWKEFFKDYRVIEVNNDEDLLYQVGTTVGGKPISNEQHSAIVDSIIIGLNIQPKDKVLDLCCGNGIITFDISTKTNCNIVGIDASPPYINNAIKLKQGPNVKYFIDDAMNVEKYLVSEKINKVVFYGAIAYFTNNEFLKLLNLFKKHKVETVFIGSILDNGRKFNYFNTLKRKLNYFWKHVLLKEDFGLGKWWSKKELEGISISMGYDIRFIDQNLIMHTAHYRTDCVLTNRTISK